ncbi:MAG: hypothetical protein HFJ36_00525 [Clostridia bacterium]|nr:hypothetical protein [Clostridia bacterium]
MENKFYFFVDSLILLVLLFLADQAEFYSHSEFTQKIFYCFKIFFGVMSVVCFLYSLFSSNKKSNKKVKDKNKPR